MNYNGSMKKSSLSILNQFSATSGDRVSELLSNPPQYTRDLDQSEPFLMILNAILSRSNELNVRFPYDRYETFDDTKVPHSFIINIIKQDPGNAVNAYQNYLPILVLDDIATQNKKKDDTPITKEFAEQIIVSFVSSYSSETISSMEKVTDFLAILLDNIKTLVPLIKDIDNGTGNFSQETAKVILSLPKIANKLKIYEEYSQQSLRFGTPPIKTLYQWNDTSAPVDDKPCAKRYTEYLFSSFKQVFSSYFSSLSIDKNSVKLVISSTYRPNVAVNAHTITASDTKGTRFNATDSFVTVNGNKHLELTKVFFYYMMHYWPGGIGIDTESPINGSNNYHIHADLRGHMGHTLTTGTAAIPTVSMVAFAEKNGTSDPSRTVSLPSLIPRDSALVSTIYKTITTTSVPTKASQAFVLKKFITYPTDPNQQKLAEEGICELGSILYTYLKAMAGISTMLYRIIFSRAYRVKSIDLSDCIESLQIQTRPGTSTYIPIEGEILPIVQSTGGRTCTITFSIKTDDLFKIASLLSMFSLDPLTETHMGMLMFGRIVGSKKGGKKRFKQLASIYRMETLSRIMDKLPGVLPASTERIENIAYLSGQAIETARLTEPLAIVNDILNGLGMSKFMPVGANVYTIDEASGVFSIKVRAQYVNYGMRSLEDFVATKYSKVPILSITSRLTYEGSDDIEDNKDPNSIPAKLSPYIISLTMGEFIPIYTLYRIIDFFDRLSNRFTKTGMTVENNYDTAKLLLSHSCLEKVCHPSIDAFATIPVSIVEDTLSNIRKKYNVYPDATEKIDMVALIRANQSSSNLIGSMLYNMVFDDDNDVKIPFSDCVIYSYFTFLHEVALLSQFGTDRVEQYIMTIVNYVSSANIDSILTYFNETLPDRPASEAPLQAIATEKKVPSLNAAAGVRVRTKSGKVRELTPVPITVDLSGVQGDQLGFSTGAKRISEELKKEVSSIYRENSHCGETIIKIGAFALGSQAASMLAQYYKYISGTFGASVEEALSATKAYKYVTGTFAGDPEKKEYFIGMAAHAFHISLSHSLIAHITEASIASITGCLADTIAYSFMSIRDLKLPNLSTHITSTYSPTSLIQYESEVYAALAKQYQLIKTASTSFAIEGIAFEQEVISGLFVDGLLQGSVSQAYTAALSSAMESIITEIYSGKGNGGESIIKTLISEHMFLSNLKDIGIVIVGFVKETLPIILIELGRFAIRALAAMITIGIVSSILGVVAVILGIIAAVFSAYIIIKAIIDSFIKESVFVVISSGSIASIALFLKNELIKGISSGQLVDICSKTAIWAPSAYEFGPQLYDPFETSYLDYPTVTAHDGTPMRPDFFVSKLHSIATDYSSLTQDIKALCSDLESFSSEVGVSPKAMMESLLTSMQQSAEAVPIGLGNTLTSIFKSGKSNGGSYTANDYAIIGQVINDIYDAAYKETMGTSLKEYSFVYISGSINNKTFAIPHRGLYAISITVTSTDDKISTSVSFNQTYAVNASYVVPKMTRAVNTSAVGAEAFINQNNSKTFVSHNIQPQIVARIIASISDSIQQYSNRQSIATSFKGDVDGDRYTLGRLLLAKSLVGSYYEQIGSAGVSTVYNRLTALTASTLVDTAFHRSSLLYPTIKLYFMEQDSEAFYLFDDIYSYASITNGAVTMDNESPQQTCILSVTNLYGKITNMFADTYASSEGTVSMVDSNYFFRGGSEFAPINSMMLRPGCKIKLLMGYKPVLDDSDTVFIGEVVSITPGPIITIEARSEGSAFLTNISEQKIKIFGQGNRSIISNIVTEVKRLIGSPINKAYYLYPINKITDIISWILSDSVEIIEKMSDVTINPDVSAQIRGDLKTTTDDMLSTLNKFFNIKFAVMSELNSESGLDFSLSMNNQLFENIKIDHSETMTAYRYFFNMDEGVWVAYNETIWDSLNELNMVLKNNILTVRPYDTRSTLVWGPQNGYYRTKRKVDSECFLTNAIIEKLVPLVEHSEEYRINTVRSMIAGVLDSKNEQLIEGSVALLTLIAFYSQQIAETFLGNDKTPLNEVVKKQRIIIGENSIVNKTGTYLWFGLPINKSIIPEKLTSEAMVQTAVNGLSQISEVIDEIIDNIGDAFPKSDAFNVSPADRTSLKDIASDVMVTNPGYNMVSKFSKALETITGIQTPFTVKSATEAVTYALSIEYACNMVLTKFLSIAYSRSSSHREISKTHIKYSSHDIVKNEITLTSPYNVANVEYPKEGTDYDDEIAKRSSSVNTTGDIPVHYKLSPYNYNIYSTYFKNATVFPSAMNSVVASFTSSLLTKLIGGMYRGKITLVGDASIRENDSILIWDEVNDMYGFIRVKSHTLLFSPEQGFLSIVEPECLAISSYNPVRSEVDTLFVLIQRLITIAMVLLSVRGASKTIRGAIMRIRNKVLVQKTLESKSTTNSFLEQMSRSKVFSWIEKGASLAIKPSKNIRTIIEKQMSAISRYSKIVSPQYNEFTVYVDKVFSLSARSRMTIETIQSQESALKAANIFTNALKTQHNVESEILKNEFNSIFQTLHTTVVEDIFKKDKKVADILISVLTTEKESNIAKQASSITRIIYTQYIQKLRRQLISLANNRTEAGKDFLNILNKYKKDKLEENVDLFIKEMFGSKSIITSAKSDAPCNEIVTSILHNASLDSAKHMYTAASNIKLAKKYLSTNKIVDGTVTFVEKDVDELIDGIKTFVIRNDSVILPELIALGTQLLTMGAAKSLFDFGWEFVDWALINSALADSVTITPLFVRGQPFVAGLEGVTKKDGEDTGFFGIMEARLKSMFDAVSYAFGDKVTSIYIETAQDIARTHNLIIPSNKVQ